MQRSGLRPDGTAQVLGGINGQSIARRLTAAASAADIEGRITGHSGRVGLAVELTRRGAPEQATAKAAISLTMIVRETPARLHPTRYVSPPRHGRRGPRGVSRADRTAAVPR